MRAKEWAARLPFGRGDHAAQGWIENLVAGVPFELSGVDLVPLVLPNAGGDPDLLAVDAMARGALEIGELPTARVASVLAINTGDVPVLLLEGEILVGCKQNRIVARSALIPPRSRAEIPVACVEQGRWSRRGATFRSGRVRAEPSLRRRTAGGPNQGRVWSEVASSLDAAGIRSPSSDYEAYLSARTAERSRETARLPEIRNQVGVIALREGRLLGLEMVGHPATFARLRDRTIPGYLSQAFAAPGDAGPVTISDPAEWLAVLRRGSYRAGPAVASGEDLAISADGLIGHGLWSGSRLLYLAAFPA
jgi:hypothetical protein